MGTTVRKNRLLVAALLLLAITAITAAVAGYAVLTPSGDGKKEGIVDFPQGKSLRKVASEMERAGLIRNSQLFILYARLTGADGRVKAGCYKVSDGLSVASILTKMINGEVYAYRFAVPEGYSIYQIAELLDGQGIARKTDFLAACTDPAILRELAISGTSVEGFLYPATYTIPPIMGPGEMVTLMVDQFRKMHRDLPDLAKKQKMTMKEVLTLASIIEKEAVLPAERPLIASVFRNRLKKGMPLQSDPTAVYGVRAFAGKVSKQDIGRRTPYNTYVVRGLPPGPIGNPGKDAIAATLRPASTNFLYFVAKQDGSHHFSTSLHEHNQAVRAYLR